MRPSDVNFLCWRLWVQPNGIYFQRKLMIKWKLRNVFEPSSSSLSCQRWVRTTHSNYVCMVCTFAILFYCQMLHFNDSIEVRTWFVIKVPFSHKNKGHNICKDIYPKWELNISIISIAFLLHLRGQYLDATHCNGFCEELLQTGLIYQVWNPISEISIQTTKACNQPLQISTILVCCRKYRSSVVPQFCVPRMKSISENKSIPVAYTCQIRASDMQCVFL